ncbi:ras and Rab interactor 2-like [Petromyzon marinus]|uniref:ras and Rab interactor 2-like n=1 Tax=Petromyzon marinus TaxID=7757 RepID=UPI003F706ADB
MLITFCLNRAGRQLGADEFMPVLTYVLVRCDIATLKQDMDYMTELMEPCMIHGEGQYYLISIQGVLYLLQHVETERCSKLFRSGSLGQWQHRVSVRSKASLRHDRHSQKSNSTVNSEADIPQSLRLVAMEEINSICSEHFSGASPGKDDALAASAEGRSQSSASSSSSIDICA